jgi:hypothetical protein
LGHMTGGKTMQPDERIDEFPIVWDHPDDENRTWSHDPMHTPDVVSPLGYDIGSNLQSQGFGQALTDLGLPVADGVMIESGVWRG